MKIVVLDDFQNVARTYADWNRLGGAVTFSNEHISDRAKLIDLLQGAAVVVLTRERTPVDAALLDAVPTLEFIAATGPAQHQPHIDAAEATRRGVAVSATGRLTGPGRWDTAELTWGLILALTKNIVTEDRTLRQGRWQTRVSTGLDEKTLGIIGLGRLGSQVARVGQAFGMEVIAWGPTLTPERAAAGGARYVERDDLFRQADIVSVHLLLSDLTRGSIGGREFSLMKPTAYLVNTARGPILREADLIEALRAGRIAGAGLDVFEQEPLPPGHPLTGLENVVLTPHIGFVTEHRLRQLYRAALANIEAYLSGTPTNLMNPEALQVRRPRVGRSGDGLR